jgi:phosphocarrier protein HPr
MRCQIKLNSITDVKEFVNITFKAENDVDLICGKYHIDGKSIMGIFSLELDRPIEMEMSDADMEKLKSQFEKFMLG